MNGKKAKGIIYCDESGFTGNDLLHEEQSFFIYSSLAIEPVVAEEIADYIIRKYRINGSELKGKNLLKYDNGRKAISHLISECAKNSKIIVFDKKYALATKLFEYIFEPVLAEVKSIFYDIGFHKFISTILYMEFKVRSQHAEEIFIDFESYIRKRDVDGLKILFKSFDSNTKLTPLLEYICQFCIAYKEKILEELDVIKQNNNLNKWTLDLTVSALFSLLCLWGLEYEQLDVYCDKSKPLQDENRIFDTMINRKERLFQTLNGTTLSMTFNLSSPIKFVRSETLYGIQIADVLASTLSFALKYPQEAIAKKWLKDISPSLTNCVVPGY